MVNKEKFALWIQSETLDEVRNMYKKANCRSMSEFIEEAVKFYCGYLSQKRNVEYLSNILVQQFQLGLNLSEDRLARLLFKLSVEMSMMMHVTAACYDIDESTLLRLRGRCVQELRELGGRIDLEKALKFQKSDTVTPIERKIYSQNADDENDYDEEDE